MFQNVACDMRCTLYIQYSWHYTSYYLLKKKISPKLCLLKILRKQTNKPFLWQSLALIAFIENEYIFKSTLPVLLQKSSEIKTVLLYPHFFPPGRRLKNKFLHWRGPRQKELERCKTCSLLLKIIIKSCKKKKKADTLLALQINVKREKAVIGFKILHCTCSV